VSLPATPLHILVQQDSWRTVGLIFLFTEIKMKHLAAYLLLTLGGNSSPSAKDIKEVLESVGIEADDERLNTLLSELKGKDIQEVCG
jgi:hypothetical protein